MLYFWRCWVFLAALRLSLVGAGRGCSPVAVPGLLAETSPRGARALGHAGFSSCGSWALEPGLRSCGAPAQLLRGMWGLPKPGLKPVCPALTGGFFTTEPPGKPCVWFLERPALSLRCISALCHSGALFLLDAKYPTAGMGLLLSSQVLLL